MTMLLVPPCTAVTETVAFSSAADLTTFSGAFGNGFIGLVQVNGVPSVEAYGTTLTALTMLTLLYLLLANTRLYLVQRLVPRSGEFCCW